MTWLSTKRNQTEKKRRRREVNGCVCVVCWMPVVPILIHLNVLNASLLPLCRYVRPCGGALKTEMPKRVCVCVCNSSATRWKGSTKVEPGRAEWAWLNMLAVTVPNAIFRLLCVRSNRSSVRCCYYDVLRLHSSTHFPAQWRTHTISVIFSVIYTHCVAHSKLHMIYNEYVAVAMSGIEQNKLFRRLFCKYFIFRPTNVFVLCIEIRFEIFFRFLIRLCSFTETDFVRCLTVDKENCVRSVSTYELFFNLCVRELSCRNANCREEQKHERARNRANRDMVQRYALAKAEQNVNSISGTCQIYEKENVESDGAGIHLWLLYRNRDSISHQPNEIFHRISFSHPAFHCFAAPTILQPA